MWPRSRSWASACAATPAWPPRMFKALAAENINIKVITTSEIKISVLIDRKYMELAVQALHDAFDVGKGVGAAVRRLRRVTHNPFPLCARCDLTWRRGPGAWPKVAKRTLMPDRSESESRKLLRRLRDTLAERGQGQDRLDRITHLIADSIGHRGLLDLPVPRPRNAGALRDRRAEERGRPPDPDEAGRRPRGPRRPHRPRPVNTANAPAEKGFRFMPETGEELYSSFLGVPIQRVGERLGVLVVQSKAARQFSEDEIYALEVVAMVLAEMTELGAFTGEGEAMSAMHKQPVMYPRRHRARKAPPRAGSGCTSRASSSPTRSPTIPWPRSNASAPPCGKLRVSVDDLLSAESARQGPEGGAGSLPDVRPFARLAAADGGRHRGAAFRPKPRWKRNNPPPAPGWNRCPTPTCANGCTTWTTCRTACCAS